MADRIGLSHAVAEMGPHAGLPRLLGPVHRRRRGGRRAARRRSEELGSRRFFGRGHKRPRPGTVPAGGNSLLARAAAVYQQGPGGLRYRRSRNALVEILREEKPDIVHSNDLPTHQMASDAARRLRIPRICHHRWLFGGPAIDWLNKYGAEHHLFVSQALMDELTGASEGLKRSSGSVVYDGLPLPEPITDKARSEARIQLKLPAEKVIVVIAGQVIERKGHADLIHAWSHLARQAADRAELVVVGDDLERHGAYREQMEQLAGSLGVPARFVGFQKNVDRWLAASDIAVVPSHVEPLGNATLEAMSMALPVIGGHVGGIPEMVVAGKTGTVGAAAGSGRVGGRPGAADSRRAVSAIARPGRPPALRGEIQPRRPRQRDPQGIRRSSFTQAGRQRHLPSRTALQRRTVAAMTRDSLAMKLLLLSEIFPPRTGGSGRWFWEIYRRLPRERVVIAAGEDPRQQAFDSAHDVRVVRVPLRQPAWGILSRRGLIDYAANVRRIRRLVRTNRIGPNPRRPDHAGRLGRLVCSIA